MPVSTLPCDTVTPRKTWRVVYRKTRMRQYTGHVSNEQRRYREFAASAAELHLEELVHEPVVDTATAPVQMSFLRGA